LLLLNTKFINEISAKNIQLPKSIQSKINSENFTFTKFRDYYHDC